MRDSLKENNILKIGNGMHFDHLRQKINIEAIQFSWSNVHVNWSATGYTV